MTEIANIIPFLVFCLAMTGTPGPNTMMVLSAAARGGLMGAGPLIAGIAGGSALQMAAVGAGVSAAIGAQSSIHLAMLISGSGFLTWIAIQIAISGPLDNEIGHRPQLLGFWRSAGF